MASITQSLGAAAYDFVFRGGLKKTSVAVFLGFFMLSSVAYLAFPQTTASVAVNTVGAQEGEFTPPPIEDGDSVYRYEGTFEGTAGPVGTKVEGDINATVDFEKEEVVAEVSGPEVQGYFEGEGDVEEGIVWGEGEVQVFGMADQPVEFEGEAEPDAVVASGTWMGKGEVSGEGVWRAEMTRESRRKAGLLDEG